MEELFARRPDRSATRATPVEILVRGRRVRLQPGRRASATDLITKDGVDLMVVASTPDTTNPVSRPVRGQRRAVHLHGRARGSRGSSAAAARPARPASSGPTTSSGASRTSIGTFLAMWDQVDDEQGRRRPVPERPRRQGLGRPHRRASPGARARPATRSSTPAATPTARRTSPPRSPRSRTPAPRSCSGSPIPPDFTTFWQQAKQQGFTAEGRARSARRCCSRRAIEALGADRQSTWAPRCGGARTTRSPARSTGQTAEELRPPTPRRPASSGPSRSASSHALFEVAAAALVAGRLHRQGGRARRHRRAQRRHDRRHRSTGRADRVAQRRQDPARRRAVAGRPRRRRASTSSSSTTPGNPDIPTDGTRRALRVTDCRPASSDGLTKRFGGVDGGRRPVLRTSPPARRSASSGPTGPGKTTTLDLRRRRRCRPTAGRIVLRRPRRHPAVGAANGAGSASAARYQIPRPFARHDGLRERAGRRQLRRPAARGRRAAAASVPSARPSRAWPGRPTCRRDPAPARPQTPRAGSRAGHRAAAAAARRDRRWPDRGRAAGAGRHRSGDPRRRAWRSSGSSTSSTRCSGRRSACMCHRLGRDADRRATRTR